MSNDENAKPTTKHDSPLIVNVGHVSVTFCRADAVGPANPCVYCKRPTNRVLVINPNSLHPRMVRSCDGCHDGLRKVPAREGDKPGILG